MPNSSSLLGFLNKIYYIIAASYLFFFPFIKKMKGLYTVASPIGVKSRDQI